MMMRAWTMPFSSPGGMFFRLGHIGVGLHRDDLSAQMLFVEVERLGAVAAVVEVGGQFHRFDLPFGNELGK